VVVGAVVSLTTRADEHAGLVNELQAAVRLLQAQLEHALVEKTAVWHSRCPVSS
jgi:hypothetical protein